jgi:hypothetical protein
MENITFYYYLFDVGIFFILFFNCTLQIYNIGHDPLHLVEGHLVY